METPVLSQYYRIKAEHRGTVLFFRLGDFYEMFAEDAVEISALLNLTLTARNGLPMCGIPYHASRSYIARLLKHGKKIAICEQVGEPQKGKGIIERKVVEVITPGTAIDEDYLESGVPNYCGAFWTDNKTCAFSYIDISTGNFYATSFPAKGGGEIIAQELERLNLKEIIVQESIINEGGQLLEVLQNKPALVLNRFMDWQFDIERGLHRLQRQFGSKLKGFGLNEKSPEIIAAGVLLDYIDGTAGNLISHISAIKLYSGDEFLGIDESSFRNLELTRNLQGTENCTLLEVLDETKTGMGRRLLTERLSRPLRSVEAIKKRLTMVETLYRNQRKLSEIRAILARVQDLERLCSRLAMEKAHAKDLVTLRNTLAQFLLLEDSVRGLNMPYENTSSISVNEKTCASLSLLKTLLEKALLDEPSTQLNEGNIIKRGFNAELDRFYELRDNGRLLLTQYLEEEKIASGISGLKINFNRIIGYYFEITNANLSKAPSYFIKRQDMVNGGRFTTERLAALQTELEGANDNIIEAEKKLFLELRAKAASLIPDISAAAQKAAEIDVAASLAQASTLYFWTRPDVNEGGALKISGGRHPVLEARLGRGEFVPNDVFLGGASPPFILLTGPNMAGKSTYLRQCALFVIMAQMGSFIPAQSAAIGIVDRIYCRVGAQDNLARGESTFLVEMNETSFILNTATVRSLVIMDEVGRGTGTNDGRAIAQAVSEDILDRIRCRTLFATHYHELAAITHPALVNKSMDIEEHNGHIIFKRCLKDGASSKSYGISVARMAGLPEPVLRRAAEIEDSLSKSAAPSPRKPPAKKQLENDAGMLF